MRMDLSPEKWRALPIQLIEIPNGLVLKRGRVEVKILGDGIANVLELLLETASGTGATEAELLALFAAPDQANIESLIQHLISRRLLVPVSADTPSATDLESPESVFYWHFGRTEEEIVGRLDDQRIVIIGVNYISRQLVVSLAACGAKDIEVRDSPLLRNQSLFDAGGELRPDVWPADIEPPTPLRLGARDIDPQDFDCLVATTDSGAKTLLRPWNELCHLHKRPFLPIVLKDLFGYIGPLVVPEETACFECLRLRERANDSDPAMRRLVDSATAGPETPVGFLPPMASSLGDIAALELIKFFAFGTPFWRAGTLIEVNLLRPDITARKVLKMPRCPVCTPLEDRPTLSSVGRSTMAMQGEEA